MLRAIFFLSVGALFGITVMCCLFAAKDADERMDRYAEKHHDPSP